MNHVIHMAAVTLIPDDHRVADDLVAKQGWRYEVGRNHAKLFPPDRTKEIVTVCTTPTSDPRAFKNFVARVRKSGGKV